MSWPLPGLRSMTYSGRPVFTSMLLKTSCFTKGLAETKAILSLLRSSNHRYPLRPGVDQAFDSPSVFVHINQQGRGNLIPVPRIVPMILKVSFDLARLRFEGHHRRGVQVIPGVEIPGPWGGVAHTKIGQVH